MVFLAHMVGILDLRQSLHDILIVINIYLMLFMPLSPYVSGIVSKEESMFILCVCLLRQQHVNIETNKLFAGFIVV